MNGGPLESQNDSWAAFFLHPRRCLSLDSRTCSRCHKSKPVEDFGPNRARPGGLDYYCRECRRGATKKYVAAHHGEVREKQRAYYAEHKEYFAAKAQRYYQAHQQERILGSATRRRTHPEEIAASWARYYEANKTKLLEAGREYRKSHAEKCRALARAYRQSHPEYNRVHARNRKARKRGNGGAHNQQDILDQIARQKGRCFYCSASLDDGYQVDHVVPLALGGSNGPENLVVACPSCNQKKHAKHPMDFAGIML